tara:strand:- start:10411 stop:10893 length:483 start_codon:yes stop_codon:yes gene_type:complete
MDMNLMNNMRKLPYELINYIIFMANPRMNNILQNEIHLESAHIMCEQHYNWWYPKMARYWHINDVETMYEIPTRIQYVPSLMYYFTKEELVFIMKQLFKCGCCKRHSQGIIPNKPHCHIIRNKRSLREINQMNNHYEEREHKCTCPCRHMLRNIERLKNA